MAPQVFAFKGRAYQGRPGTERCVLEVREDFGDWRKATSDNGETIARWLVAHGYRMCYEKNGKGEAWDYEQWWALTSLIGKSGEVAPSRLRELLDNQREYAKHRADAINEMEEAHDAVKREDAKAEDVQRMLDAVRAGQQREINALVAQGLSLREAWEEYKHNHG